MDTQSLLDARRFECHLQLCAELCEALEAGNERQRDPSAEGIHLLAEEHVALEVLV